MSQQRTHFRPECEALEDRFMPSANPIPEALSGAAEAFTHSREYYTQMVTNAYQHYLGRSPADAEKAGWVNALANGLTSERFEAGFVGSREYITNHGGPGAAWVKAMYDDLLHRANPADQEVAGWVGALTDGASAAEVATAFASSAERAGGRIFDDYQLLLHRTASADEVKAWLNHAASQGLTNEDVLARLLTSDEYLHAHGQQYMDDHHYPDLPPGYQWFGDAMFRLGNTPENYLTGHGSSSLDWLEGVYHEVLGRAPEVEGLNGWLRALESGFSVGKTFGGMLE